MGWQYTLIQLDVAATKKLCWLCRLSTGSLNILDTLFCLFYFLKCVSSPYYGVSPFGVFFYKADLKIQFCNLVRRNGTKNGTNLPIIPSKNESPRHPTDRVNLYTEVWFINAFLTFVRIVLMDFGEESQIVLPACPQGEVLPCELRSKSPCSKYGRVL